MVKDHSDSEKGNPLPSHRLLFSISSKDRRKEVFYLMTQSIHFTYGYMEGRKCGKGIMNTLLNDRRKEGRKEGGVLFKDTLNTFYLRLYDVRHVVKE